jgi:hypothetical protein
MHRSTPIGLPLFVALMLLALTGQLAAQAVPAGRGPLGGSESQKPTKGFTLYESFEGSTTTDGQVMDLTTTVGYNFGKSFGVDVGVPVYFTRAAAPFVTSGLRSGNSLGDVFTDVRFSLEGALLNYSSTITAAAPTGAPGNGTSTGRATVNWDNRFDHDFGRFTPFADIGVGTSVRDTRRFQRPFKTLGREAQFEVGSDVAIWGPLSFSASAYDVAPWGTQRVFSRVKRAPKAATSGAGSGSSSGKGGRGRVFETQNETVGTADLVRDNGFSAGFTLNPVPIVTVDVGYTRSVRFALDTITFGVGVDLSSLLRRHRHP